MEYGIDNSIAKHNIYFTTFAKENEILNNLKYMFCFFRNSTKDEQFDLSSHYLIPKLIKGVKA